MLKEDSALREYRSSFPGLLFQKILGVLGDRGESILSGG